MILGIKLLLSKIGCLIWNKVFCWLDKINEGYFLWFLFILE